jgi:hypothetical protein
MITLKTKSYITADGDKSKAIVVTVDTMSGVEIVIFRLGVKEARALSAALKPTGKNINFNRTKENQS